MSALTEKTFRKITDLMHEAVGLSFSPSKMPLVSSRLSSRIRKLELSGYEEYLALITGADDGGEFQVAVDLLTTNETYFFREPHHYDLLETELAQQAHRPLALWSAASSFGDEAFSTAMLLSDMETKGQIGPQWSILGTDISDRVLQSATTAIYPAERLRNVTETRKKRYTLRGEGENVFRAARAISRHVQLSWVTSLRKS